MDMVSKSVLLSLAIKINGADFYKSYPGSVVLPGVVELCYPPLAPFSKPTCAAPLVWTESNKRTKRFTPTSSMLGAVHSLMRYKQGRFLIKREEATDKERASLEEKQETKQAERARLLETLENGSLLRMEKARTHLRRLLLTRRDGT